MCKIQNFNFNTVGEYGFKLKQSTELVTLSQKLSLHKRINLNLDIFLKEKDMEKIMEN